MGSHIRHHPSATPTSGGESPGHAHLTSKTGVEPIEQELLRKYVVYSKEKVCRLIYSPYIVCMNLYFETLAQNNLSKAGHHKLSNIP